MSDSYTVLPPEITVSQREVVRDTYYSSYYLDVTVSNPNLVTLDTVSATLRVSSADGTVVFDPEGVSDFDTYSYDITNYSQVQDWVVTLENAYAETSLVSAENPRIADVTEKVGMTRYYPVSVLTKDALVGENDARVMYYLKAFCTFPGTGDVYGRWEISSDGIEWSELTSASTGSYLSESLADIDYKYDTFGNVILDEDLPTVYSVRTFYKLRGSADSQVPLSPKDSIAARYDCIPCTASLLGKQVRFRMVTVDDSRTIAIDGTGYHPVKLELGQAIYIPVYGSELEVLDSELPSASLGTPLYHNRTLYTYGVKSEQAVIYASEVGSLIRPLSRVLDLDSSSADIVTALIPWRDYLIAATEHSLHLIMRSGTGFTSKIINPSIGIPVEDSRCCVPVLNGVIFKSGNRIFQLYPNIYSGEDTVLNVSDLSKPISAYNLSANQSFAFSSEEAYYLMLTKSTETECWKYNYVFKTWMRFKYPIVSYGYFLQNISNIKLYGCADNGWGTFVIERELNDLIAEFDVPTNAIANLLYGDYVRYRLDQLSQYSIGELVEDPISAELVPMRTPIPYTLDSGQKIDNISYTKQFTEAKFVFVTEHNKDRFPCEVLVHVDGDSRTIKIDVNADSSFWVSTTDFAKEPLTLGTAIYSDEADLLNTFRHLFLRYSGKGRSIRFKITGNSVYRFRVHSILSRYRTLNVKQ